MQPRVFLWVTCGVVLWAGILIYQDVLPVASSVIRFYNTGGFPSLTWFVIYIRKSVAWSR